MANLNESNEVWKDIFGYEGLYQISNLGRVRRFIKSRRRLLKPFINNAGYYSIALCKDGKSHFKLIHRLIAIHFIPNKIAKPFVNHIDGNKLNNKIINLEWVTHSENIKHAYFSNLIPFRNGSMNPVAKLTESDVYLIRLMQKCGISRKKVCAIYDIHKATYQDIKTRRIWKHV